jgi:hypothetical protein
MADKKIVVNCTTGEVTEVELTAEELTQREADRIAHVAWKAEQDAIKAQEALDRASGEAKLAAVGLTKAEIKAIRKAN